MSIDSKIQRVSFIRYNPQNPTKWGIRIYVLADANIGYIQTILPYDSFTTKKLVRLISQ